MNHDELRLECLKLAQSRLDGHSNKQIVDHARVYADFVLDRHPRPMESGHATIEADPPQPPAPGHEVSGYVSPPTT